MAPATRDVESLQVRDLDSDLTDVPWELHVRRMGRDPGFPDDFMRFGVEFANGSLHKTRGRFTAWESRFCAGIRCARAHAQREVRSRVGSSEWDVASVGAVAELKQHRAEQVGEALLLRG
jgi:hypothetical protein